MTFKHYTLLAIAAVPLLMASTVRAEDAPQIMEQEAGKEQKFERRGHEMFQKTDADKDGFLSFEEMESSHRNRMQEMFKKSDTDGDGKLSPAELRKGREAMRERFRSKFREQNGEGGEERGEFRERMKERMEKRHVRGDDEGMPPPDNAGQPE